MNTNKTRGILLGLGVLGASTLLGTLSSAQAAPKVTTKKVTTIQYGRNNDRHDNNRRDDRYDNNWNNNRFDHRGPAFPNRPLGNSYLPNRPGQGFQTLTGVVTNDLDGNDFKMTTSGGITTVIYPKGEPSKLSKGDRVQVSGAYSNGIFRAQSLSILRNR